MTMLSKEESGSEAEVDHTDPSSFPDVPTQKSTTTPTTTTTVKPPLDSKLIVSTVSQSRDVSPIPSSVPGNLCHFLMCGPITAPFMTTPDARLNKSTALVSTLLTTRFGIDIKRGTQSQVISQLNTATGMGTTTTHGKNVFHYSCLDFDIRVNTSSADVNQFIQFLKKISKVQFDNEGNLRTLGYVFAGVSPIGSDSGNMRDHVQRIINEARPDGILFLTTYVKTKTSGFRAAVPSAWTMPTISDRPTFICISNNSSTYLYYFNPYVGNQDICDTPRPPKSRLACWLEGCDTAIHGTEMLKAYTEYGHQGWLGDVRRPVL
ncbi:uncharacterized protein LOC135387843 isoform X2 [Ornithodoros turicata]|uniref:uncharacterized protein LOC135387843 isoform X2 n=1 Tax=Ornithodoros turicata TaxID=34597 RepID=UPI003138C055